jgi:hypothetical protein
MHFAISRFTAAMLLFVAAIMLISFAEGSK